MTGLRECRAGGDCDVCNPKPLLCQGCLSVEVETRGDLCPECEAQEIEDFVGCDWCGDPTDDGKKFCSKGCARAAESDHA